METAVFHKTGPNTVVSLRDIPLALWCFLGTALVLAITLLQNGDRVIGVWGDTDDATRMVQVREWMAHRNWYDATLPKFGGETPYVSHWSRLIDVPIGALIGFFGWFVSQHHAELSAIIVWPTLLFFIALLVCTRTAEVFGGRTAALFVIALAVCANYGFSQFRPGRIDHHSVMILGAVGGIFYLARSFSCPKLGTVAGVLFGCGLSVGYEAILLTAVGLGVAALISLATDAGVGGMRRASASLAVTVVAGFVLTVAPHRWLDVHCDALSLNMVILIGVSAAGFLLASSFPRPALWKRYAALACAGAVALTAFGWAGPICLGGPFAQVDANVFTLWLSTVSETQNIVWLWQKFPSIAVGFAVFMLTSVGSALLWFRLEKSPDVGFLAIVMSFAAAGGLWQIKLMPYAALMGTVCLAIALGKESIIPSLPTLRSRLIVVLLSSEKIIVTFTSLALAASSYGAVQNSTAAVAAAMSTCFTKSAFAPLASLDSGVFLAHVDLGPFIAVETGHAVLAAPYHRLGKQIVAAHDILSSRLDDAEAKLRRVGADYVAVCEGLGPWIKEAPAGGGPILEAELLAGRSPPYLTPVASSGDTVIRVWKVQPPTK